MDTTLHHLDPVREKKRRLQILLRVVPGLLNRTLTPVLGWRRWPFILTLFIHAPFSRKAFSRPGDDDGLKEVKRTFLLVGVLYNRLRYRLNEEAALRTARTFLNELGNAVQRQAYTPPADEPRKWEWFHREHEAQIREGFIRNNENDGIVSSADNVSLHITRCRFYEAFRDMGNAALAEGFCRSDEIVFNEVVPDMRFHRGPLPQNTIARGAPRCIFIYERIPFPNEQKRPQS